MGRPRLKFDLTEIEKLYNMQCTDDEVAAFFGVSTRTMRRRMQTSKFRDVKERALAKGRISVRRNLFRLAGAGNIAAAIFLSKNILGYRDVVNNQLTGIGGEPIQLSVKPDLRRLTDEELAQLRRITEKAKTD